MVSLNSSSWMIQKAKVEDILYYNDLQHRLMVMSQTRGHTPANMNEGICIRRLPYILGSGWTTMCSSMCLSRRQPIHFGGSQGSCVREETIGKKAFSQKACEFDVSGGSIVRHLNEIHSIVNQLSATKMFLDNELQDYFLGSLPDNWKTLVVSLNNSTSDGVCSPRVKLQVVFQ